MLFRSSIGFRVQLLSRGAYVFTLCGVLVISALCVSCLQAGEGLTGELGEVLPPRGEYPAGPYGEEIGEVIAPLSFLDADGREVSLRKTYRNYHHQLLLITTSAEWCTACIKEQPKLEELYQTYKSRGLSVIVTMFQDGNFEPATPAVATEWRDKYNLSFPVFADPANPSTFSPYYDVNLTPMVMLVEVATMRIVYLTQGFDEDQIITQLNARLPDQLPRPATYPEGPYGTNEGDVIADLTLTDQRGAPWRLGGTYRDLSKRVLLLTTSAEWCTACIKEQPKLEELYQEFKDREIGRAHV